MDKKDILKELYNILKLTPEADSCYYKNECGKNCTPKKNNRKRARMLYKENKIDLKTYIEEPCMYELIEKLINKIGE